jgi:integrase
VEQIKPKEVNGSMASRKRQSVVGYAGVYFIEVTRAAGYGMEKVYYIRYRKQGKLIEEKVGGQYRDNMTAAKAASIRGQRMEGKDATNEEKRAAVRAAKVEEESRYSFNKLWSLFEEAKSANRTVKDDRIRYNLHIAPSLGTKSIPELTVHDIDKLRVKLEKAGKSPQTVKHVLTLIKRMLNFALRRGYVESIPGTLHITMPTVDNKVTENLTAEQVQKLLQALDEEADQVQASIVRLALFTGMRRSALLNLEWGDLDFERGFITLRGDVAKKQKTETIPMNDQARAILNGLPQTKSPYVFPGRYDDKPRGNISPMLKRVREKVGLPESFRPLHGLRHSFASWLASSGQVSMYELQKLLTHSSPQMTQRYAHLHDDALKKASGVASTLFSAAQNKESSQASQEAPKTVETKIRSKKRQAKSENA